nr:hypothetical protein CFP56_30185 [Quercus suber]
MSAHAVQPATSCLDAVRTSSCVRPRRCSHELSAGSRRTGTRGNDASPGAGVAVLYRTVSNIGTVAAYSTVNQLDVVRPRRGHGDELGRHVMADHETSWIRMFGWSCPTLHSRAAREQPMKPDVPDLNPDALARLVLGVQGLAAKPKAGVSATSCANCRPTLMQPSSGPSNGLAPNSPDPPLATPPPALRHRTPARPPHSLQ